VYNAIRFVVTLSIVLFTRPPQEICRQFHVPA
jgi:hypothetical protein